MGAPGAAGMTLAGLARKSLVRLCHGSAMPRDHLSNIARAPAAGFDGKDLTHYGCNLGNRGRRPDPRTAICLRMRQRLVFLPGAGGKTRAGKSRTKSDPVAAKSTMFERNVRKEERTSGLPGRPSQQVLPAQHSVSTMRASPSESHSIDTVFFRGWTMWPYQSSAVSPPSFAFEGTRIPHMLASGGRPTVVVTSPPTRSRQRKSVLP